MNENRCWASALGLKLSTPERTGDSANTMYGLVPVLEALRAGHKRLEQITIAEGARHERLT